MALGPARPDGGDGESADDPYRVMAEELPDATILFLDRDLRFQLVTGAGLRDGLVRSDHYLGHTVLELAPAEQAETLAGHYRAALAGERRQFVTPGWRDPSRTWQVDAIPVHERQGVVGGVMLFCRDVTEHDRAEAALRDSRRQLAEAQRLARIGSWDWEPATNRVTWSQELYRILGADPEEEVTVDSALGFVHPDDRPALQAAMARIVVDPAPFAVELRAVLPDGAVRTLLARGEGIRDGTGQVVRVIGTNQDVTEAKQAEEERRRLLARLYEALEGQQQRLAADLHDEHVQAVAAVALKVDRARLMLGRGEPAAAYDLLGKLRDDLGDELVGLRRTIAALRPLVLDQRGLEAAVRELVAATCDRALLKRCEVKVDLGYQPLDPAVETAVFRVLQQALANVEQHAAAGRLRVALERQDTMVVLDVEDDGCGFDPVEVEVVPGQGGFGLVSMRERVQAIGGRLTVTTRKGGGTRLRAWVPAEGVR
ncbi:MAG TPA: PAS domain-containing protein [Actinomycetes bacterium]